MPDLPVHPASVCGAGAVRYAAVLLCPLRRLRSQLASGWLAACASLVAATCS